MARHSQNPSQTQTVTLPANRAFVVQFQGTGLRPTVTIAGRVEHLMSGRRARFQSWRELQRFIEQELTQIKTTAVDPTSEESDET